MLHDRAFRRLLWVVGVGLGWCGGCTFDGELGFFAHRLAGSEIRVGPICVLHRYIKGGGGFGVTRLSTLKVGRLGLVGRAVFGACFCAK